MRARLPLLAALVLALGSMGASYRTTNFVVHAPTPEIAQQVGQWAEHYRREKALEWLGFEMPAWPAPCPLTVQVTADGPSGATSFNFGPGGVAGQRMEIQGPLPRLIKSVLPHEVTHTIFAYYFRRPVPRWADEGGSVLSEDDVERVRHDQMVRSILNQGRQIQLRQLMQLREYPRDVMCLYAQGYSVTNFLVNRSDKKTFLQFLHHGMTRGWDSAVWTFYRHRTVEELEEAWLKHLRETKGQPHIQLAKDKQHTAPTATAATGGNNGTVVRLTIPLELLQQQPPAGVARGQSDDDPGQRPGRAPAMPTSRPTYLPQYSSPSTPVPPAPTPATGWQAPTPPGLYQPAQPGLYQPVPVQLGPPQFGPAPGEVPQSGRPSSPVGFPQ